MYSDVPALLILIVGGLVLAAIFASFCWVGATFQGRKRTVAIVVVLIFWVGAYWFEGGGREDVQRYWQKKAEETCTVDIENPLGLPDIDGLLDENTLLTPNAVLHLFVQNNLKFVEVRVGKGVSRTDPKSIGYGYVWRKSETEKLYAKLELTQKGDAKCIRLPDEIAGRESRAPFLPDTCVKASFSDKPTARYSLEFTPAKYSDWPFLSRYGAWSIIDRQDGKRLATAKTYWQKPIQIEMLRPDELLRFDFEAYYSDRSSCIFGGGLLSRVRSIPSSDLGNSRFLVPKRLSIQDPIPVLDDADVPVIKPKKLFKEDSNFTDNAPNFYEKACGDTVALAQKNNWSSYSHFGEAYLIHWGSRKIIGLKIQPSSKEYAWREFSIEDGFILFSYPLLGAKNSERGSKVLRYTSDGQLVWSAKLSPSEGSVGRCQTIDPKRVYIDGEDLILTTHCTTKERGGEVREVWSIPLGSFPGSFN